mmetsp:Transcript_17767/g.50014  ORF Transcript_17767/g.50014 Transcript_17767/m.50014 type:complete len:226 (-) Transcript_17767:724-1401(-)
MLHNPQSDTLGGLTAREAGSSARRGLARSRGLYAGALYRVDVSPRRCFHAAHPRAPPPWPVGERCVQRNDGRRGGLPAVPPDARLLGPCGSACHCRALGDRPRPRRGHQRRALDYSLGAEPVSRGLHLSRGGRPQPGPERPGIRPRRCSGRCRAPVPRRWAARICGVDGLSKRGATLGFGRSLRVGQGCRLPSSPRVAGTGSRLPGPADRSRNAVCGGCCGHPMG